MANMVWASGDEMRLEQRDQNMLIRILLLSFAAFSIISSVSVHAVMAQQIKSDLVEIESNLLSM